MSIPLHEIWYYADAKVTLYNSSNIVSHTFADGKGVLSVASNVDSLGQWLRGTAITNVEIADNFTRIGDYAFRDCSNLALTSLPEGLTSLGNYAFRGCTNIKFLVVNSYIPPTLGVNTFSYTTFRIYVPSDKLNDYRSEWSSYASRIYQMSSISYIMTPDGFVYLTEDSIHRKRIVSQIRQTATIL